jgi:hypothetical protein
VAPVSDHSRPIGQSVERHTPPCGHPSPEGIRSRRFSKVTSPRGDLVETRLEGHPSRGDPVETLFEDPLSRGVARSAGVCGLGMAASIPPVLWKVLHCPPPVVYVVPPRRTDWETSFLWVRWDGCGRSLALLGNGGRKPFRFDLIPPMNRTRRGAPRARPCRRSKDQKGAARLPPTPGHAVLTPASPNPGASPSRRFRCSCRTRCP